MKWSIIRVGIITMFMGMTTIVFGMTDDDREQRRAERHQRKLEQYKSGWNRLIPKYQNVQYAGSMGLLSLGVGWDYGRKKQWETEIMFGLVPRFSSNKAKVTFTLKQNYAPWEVRLGGKWWLEPLVTGLYMNTVLSDDFWVKKDTRITIISFPPVYAFISLPDSELLSILGLILPFVESLHFTS